MADETSKPKLTAASVATLVKLLETAKELHERQAAILEELDAILGGRAGTAAKLKLLEKGFDELWSARYARGASGHYVWSHAKDRANMKTLLRKMDVDEILARAARYLRSEDGFHARNRHSWGLFVSSINQWTAHAPANGELELEPVADCKHVPPCQSDQEHTRRTLTDMRGAR